MNFVNLTPHVLNVKSADGNVHSLLSAGVARVSQLPAGEPELTDGFEIRPAPAFGEVAGLPEPDGKSIFVVSALVAGRCGGRRDVVSPDTGPSAVRNTAGQIEYVLGFVRAPN